MTRHDVVNYPPRLDSVTAARRRAAWLAVAWGWAQAATDVALVTSELTTNALLHGSMSDRFIRVELALTEAGLLRVAVTDPKGERRPELQHVGADRRFGRGLHIVDALSRHWGVDDRTIGKTVWAELAAPVPT